MNEERRQLIHKLAEGARELAEDLRPIEEVSGEAWVNADWLADELEALDWDLAREALAEGSERDNGVTPVKARGDVAARSEGVSV